MESYRFERHPLILSAFCILSPFPFLSFGTHPRPTQSILPTRLGPLLSQHRTGKSTKVSRSPVMLKVFSNQAFKPIGFHHCHHPSWAYTLHSSWISQRRQSTSSADGSAHPTAGIQPPDDLMFVTWEPDLLLYMVNSEELSDLKTSF